MDMIELTLSQALVRWMTAKASASSMAEQSRPLPVSGLFSGMAMSPVWERRFIRLGTACRPIAAIMNRGWRTRQ